MNNELVHQYALELRGLYEQGKFDFDSRHSGVESLMQMVAEAGIEWSLVVWQANQLHERKTTIARLKSEENSVGTHVVRAESESGKTIGALTFSDVIRDGVRQGFIENIILNPVYRDSSMYQDFIDRCLYHAFFTHGLNYTEVVLDLSTWDGDSEGIINAAKSLGFQRVNDEMILTRTAWQASGNIE